MGWRGRARHASASARPCRTRGSWSTTNERRVLGHSPRPSSARALRTHLPLSRRRAAPGRRPFTAPTPRLDRRVIDSCHEGAAPGEAGVRGCARGGGDRARSLRRASDPKHGPRHARGVSSATGRRDRRDRKRRLGGRPAADPARSDDLRRDSRRTSDRSQEGPVAPAGADLRRRHVLRLGRAGARRRRRLLRRQRHPPPSRGRDARRASSAAGRLEHFGPASAHSSGPAASRVPRARSGGAQVPRPRLRTPRPHAGRTRRAPEGRHGRARSAPVRRLRAGLPRRISGAAPGLRDRRLHPPRRLSRDRGRARDGRAQDPGACARPCAHRPSDEPPGLGARTRSPSRQRH